MINLETEKLIKTDLQSIVKNDFALPKGTNDYQAVQQVVRSLSSTDAELRDELGITILSKWLIQQNLLNAEQLEELLFQTLSDEKLFYKIGEINTDSVFLRSFSSLLIALILIRDKQENFLSERSFQFVVNRLVIYCEQEKDLRGFVEGKGWAHAAAHMSDAIDECAYSKLLEYEDCKQLCHGLFQLLIHAPFVYDAEEDERIVGAVVAMIAAEKISLLNVSDWLKEIKLSEGSEALQRYQRINFKHFLRSLYMRLREKELFGEEEYRLIEVEHQFNPYFIKL